MLWRQPYADSPSRACLQLCTSGGAQLPPDAREVCDLGEMGGVCHFRSQQRRVGVGTGKGGQGQRVETAAENTSGRRWASPGNKNTTVCTRENLFMSQRPAFLVCMEIWPPVLALRYITGPRRKYISIQPTAGVGRDSGETCQPALLTVRAGGGTQGVCHSGWASLASLLSPVSSV